jgi:hypothetical protein
MVSLVIHLCLLPFAGWALFLLWRATQSSDRLTNGVVTGGFLLRALAGQVLFWISYAKLPFARHLQLGDGFWSFGQDGLLYVPKATEIAHEGVLSILSLPTSYPSVAYTKLLAFGVLMFGGVVAVAILLNLFSFLAAAVILMRWVDPNRNATFARRVAICAISISPAAILWSTQPLKDNFFQLVVIAFLGLCAAWQRTWTRPSAAMWRAAILGALMIMTLTTMAAIRWYVALGIFASGIVFFLLVASTSAVRKSIAFGSAVVVIVLLSRGLLYGSGNYAPQPMRYALSPLTAFHDSNASPVRIARLFLSRLEVTRVGFELTGGGTAIRLGNRVTAIDARSKPVPLPAEITNTALASSEGGAAINPAAYEEAQKTSLKEAPKSWPVRLLTGCAAVFMPRVVGERLGLFHIGGGQGMFWFTDLDTLLFNAVVVCALWIFFTRRSASLRNPLVWLVVMSTIVATAALAYAISNYGTLFRLRGTVYVCLALLPLAVATSRGSEGTPISA